jgi:hypothetical protein
MTKTDEAGSTSANSTADRVMEQKLVQFAERLGYVIGTVEAKADGWLDRDALRTQLTSVRDAASELLKQVTAKARAGRTRAQSKTSAKKASAAADLAHAPGKRHRKPPPQARVKKSDQTVAKLRTAAANRQRRGG